jgi:hypothetical protein
VREEKGEWKYNGGGNLFRYTVCMYGIITMNFLIFLK